MRCLRFWLIRKLAGRDTAIINAMFSEEGVTTTSGSTAEIIYHRRPQTFAWGDKEPE